VLLSKVKGAKAVKGARAVLVNPVKNLTNRAKANNRVEVREDKAAKVGPEGVPTHREPHGTWVAMKVIRPIKKARVALSQERIFLSSPTSFVKSRK